jgi:hypothetical protein
VIPLSIALAMATTGSPPAPPTPWRLVDVQTLHVGVRPAALVTRDEVAVGITVQVSGNVL